jgi:holo-[acyl-carrier protein] synthase
VIAGIGVDIASISRFQRFIDDGNLALIARLFTERERTVCDSRRSSASCYAARFAAKEAFLKALGTGLRQGMSWHDLEVVSDRLGKPLLHLSGTAGQLFDERRLTLIHLSLSHDGDSAVALVVLEAP